MTPFPFLLACAPGGAVVAGDATPAGQVTALTADTGAATTPCFAEWADRGAFALLPEGVRAAPDASSDGDTLWLTWRGVTPPTDDAAVATVAVSCDALPGPALTYGAPQEAHLRPSVAAQSGAWLLAWEGLHGNGGGGMRTDVFRSVVDEDGAIVTRPGVLPLTVDGSATDDQTGDPHVVAHPDGGFTVLATRRSATTWAFDLLVISLDERGDPIADAVAVPAGALPVEPVVAPTTPLTLGWLEQGPPRQVVLSTFDDDTAHETFRAEGTDLQLTATEDGPWATWRTSDAPHIHVRTPDGVVVALSDTHTGFGSEPAVAVGPRSAAVAWYHQPFDGPAQVHLASLGRDGTVLGERVLRDGIASGLESLALVHTRDDVYVALWVDGPEPWARALYARVVDLRPATSRSSVLDR